MRRLLLFVGPYLERAWAVWALKDGATQALRDIWEEVQPRPEDVREVYGLVDKGVLTEGGGYMLALICKPLVNCLLSKNALPKGKNPSGAFCANNL